MIRKGYSLLESVIVIAIIAILVGAGAGSVQKLAPKYHLEKAVWEARSRLSQARVRAIWEGASYRVRFAESCYFLEMYEEPAKEWVIRQSGPLDGVIVEANNSPIFHPTGTVSNLATIVVSNSRGRYRITLAISGRIKVAKG